MGATHTFTHQGKPRPKERPRLGRGGHVYTPKRTLEAEEAVRESYDGPLFEGPIGVEMRFYDDRTEVTIYEWPHSKNKVRGDVDNLNKLLLDALQGKAYENDNQVMHLVATKVAE